MIEENNSNKVSGKELLAGTVAVIVALFMLTRNSRISTPSQTDLKPDDDDGRQSSKPDHSAPKAEPGISKSETCCQSENTCRRIRYTCVPRVDWWSRWIGIGTLIAAAIAACVYSFQLAAMQGQLNEMATTRRDTEAQLRADVVHIEPVMWPMDAQNKLVARDSPNIAAWSVSPGWKNGGSTAAMDFSHGYDLSEKPRDWSKDVHDIYKTCPARPKVSYPGIRLSPNDPKVELGKNLAFDVAERAQNGTLAIFYVLNATYRDIFQKPRDALHHYYVCVLIEVHDAKTSQFSFLQVDRQID